MSPWPRKFAIAAGAAALLVAPVSFHNYASIVGSQSAFADKGGGGHDGGPSGGNGGGGNGGGNHGDGSRSADGASNGGNSAGNGKGNAFGRETQTADANPGASKNLGQALGYGTTSIAKTDPLHPSKLGRLNGFLNASSIALAATSPNSAIGTVSKTYRDMLSAYLSDDELSQLDLDDLAAALATAANKELSTEQVQAINERLAIENPHDPNLSGLGNPTGDPTIDAQNRAFADELAGRANEVQAEETNQGLGQRIAGFFESIL
ncbi:MAG: hypothetical protein SGJ07_09970 [Rhodospirillaceae bacterium]|nr:hypothetical protein [Rhodospirillaceae bacterium]